MYSELHAIFGESVGNEFVPRKSIQPVLLSVRQYLRIKDGIAAVCLPVDIHPAFKGGNRGRTCKYIIWKKQGAFLVRRLPFQRLMNYYIIYNIKMAFEERRITTEKCLEEIYKHTLIVLLFATN